MTTFIYCLIDPRTNQVRYIGKSDHPTQRYKEHLYQNRKTYLKDWVKSLKKENLKPELIILDEVLLSEWEFWEKHYISLYKSWGFKLCNMTEGGDGIIHTEEIKAKISKATLLRFSNPLILLNHRKHKQLQQGTKIIVINSTEEVYYNAISEAARELNLKAKKISEYIKGKRYGKYKGYTFKLV